MKNFIDQFFANIIELNLSLGIVCVTIFLITSVSRGCANEQLSEKNRTQYMTECIKAGKAPSECAIGWRTSRNP